MCEQGYSLWPTSITCQAPFGYCSTRDSNYTNGYANSNLNGTGSLTCICNEGYTHDLAVMRFRDCRLPIMFYPVIDGLYSFFALLCLMYSLYYLRKAKSLARYIIYSTIGLEISSFLLGAIRYGHNHCMVAGTVFLFYVIVSFGCLCLYLTAYSMAYPLYSISRLSISRLQYYIKISFVFFRIIGFIPVLIVAVLYNDCNDESNDRGWNKSGAADSAIFAFEMTIIIIMAAYHGFQMINTVNNFSKDLPTSPARLASTKDYLDRVKRYLVFLVCFTPGIVFGAFLLPVFYISSGYVPYTFAFLACTQFASLLFTVIQTKFAVSSKVFQNTHVSNNGNTGDAAKQATGEAVKQITSNQLPLSVQNPAIIKDMKV